MSRQHLLVALVVVASCALAVYGVKTRSNAPTPLVPSAVTASDTMARSMLRLAREQLVSNNPARVQDARNCEFSRLSRIVGVDSTFKLADVVEREIRVTTTEAARERVLDSLAMKEFIAEVWCESFAAAGALGGPWTWGTSRGLPGDSIWRSKGPHPQLQSQEGSSVPR